MDGLKSSALMITAHYYPEPNMITKDLAEYLLNKGLSVTVLTAHPNYPLGKFYPSVTSLWPKKTIENNIVVWRLPFWPDHSVSKFRRFASYLSFLFIAILWAPFIVKNPAQVWVYQTPFTSALAALWFKWVYSSKLYYVCADLWPESFTAAGVAPKKGIMRLLFWYSRWINTQADFMLCSTPGMVSRYAEDKIPSSKLAFVPVWVAGIPMELVSDLRKKFLSRTIVYAGNFGPAQNLTSVIDAARLCETDGLNLTFHFYGAGAEDLELRKRAKGLSRVFFMGKVTPEEAFRAQQSAFAILVPLAGSPMFRMTLPSKLASAFAAGGLVLAGLEGVGKDMTEKSGGGFAFKPGDADALHSCLKTLCELDYIAYKNICQNSKKFFERCFNQQTLLGFYGEVIDHGLTGGLVL